VSKYRKASADATIAELFQRNPDLANENPRLHPAAIDGQQVAQAIAKMAPALKSAFQPVPTEHEEQVALFQWAEANEGEHEELKLLFAVPNGGYRPMATAAMLREEGVRAGVPDCCLPVARGRFHSLWLELKRSDRSNHATPAQQEWIERLRSYGHMTAVCYGAQEAIEVITGYLNQA
jgi:hypothetical protein